ncbi:MAG: flagellar filament outer layer protein FlaA [Treponemataceae bacterium]|nr:MAG: flagellar filament outer layer protein FlaA [Treponemataceae bacterium]
MKKVLVIFICLLSAGALAAQTSLADPDANTIGADSARAALREVSVDLFEREGSWVAHISPDNGIIAARLQDGSPATKPALPESGETAPSDTKVLAVKVEFFHRGINSFEVKAVQPIPIEGTTKTVSFWVAGRNQRHTVTLLVRDYFQRNYELYVGDLAFTGWKKLTVTIPPSPDGERGIVQASPYHGDRPGLSIVGFRIDCNPMQARGSYYIYFDDLRAVTDLFGYENKEPDDMDDNW